MKAKIIYTHGMGGSPADWSAVQEGYPGFSLPLDDSTSGPVECARALADEAVRLGSGPFVLCGYSMGGRIAVLAARELLSRGLRPAGLVLVSSGLGFASAAEREERNARDEEWAALAEKSLEEFWTRWYGQELFSSFLSQPLSTQRAWLEDRKSIDVGKLTGQLRKLGPGRHEPLRPVVLDLAAKGVRMLYLAGELDKKYLELSRTMRAIPGVEADAIPGAGHALPLEAPEALAARIARFLG